MNTNKNGRHNLLNEYRNNSSQRHFIVWDIETQTNIAAGDSYEDQRISVGAYYCSQNKQIYTFTEDTIKSFLYKFQHSRLAVGHYTNTFDCRVLKKYANFSVWETPSFDMCDILKSTIGRSVKLDNLARNTFNKGKTGSGRDAPRLWQNYLSLSQEAYNEVNTQEEQENFQQQAENVLDKLNKYVIQDVNLTTKVFGHAMNHGFLKYYDKKSGEINTIDTSMWPSLARSLWNGFDAVDNMLLKFGYSDKLRERVMSDMSSEVEE